MCWIKFLAISVLGNNVSRETIAITICFNPEGVITIMFFHTCNDSIFFDNILFTQVPQSMINM